MLSCFHKVVPTLEIIPSQLYFENEMMVLLCAYDMSSLVAAGVNNWSVSIAINSSMTAWSNRTLDSWSGSFAAIGSVLSAVENSSSYVLNISSLAATSSLTVVCTLKVPALSEEVSNAATFTVLPSAGE